jgi:hypothetical protein
MDLQKSRDGNPIAYSNASVVAENVTWTGRNTLLTGKSATTEREPEMKHGHEVCEECAFGVLQIPGTKVSAVMLN